MSYELLSEPIRRYIRDRKWNNIRPIQAAAITRILASEDNFILASGTASGKTEAAFLPVLSKVNFREPGVQVLYISPLIALINDQFERAEALCKYLDVRVTKWHGEANRSAKEKLLKNPEGIVLITPESIEALFTNRPTYLRHLFGNLKFIIIDEIHTFLGSDRGLHLKSLLSRISSINIVPIRIVGLSATIGDYNEAKKITGKEDGTKVLVDRTAKDIEARFCFYKIETDVFSLQFIETLYEEVKNKKVLIFPNSRGKAEELAVKLKKASERKGGHPYYFSHHSSIDKEIREYVEDFAKNNKRSHFCIVCTSTLELGIDIGTVDIVVQVDAPHSIASLIQRVGRSGRREGASSNLLLYATDKWELLQSCSCWELFQSGFIEPISNQQKPFDLLFHQLLSVLKETGGISKTALLERMQSNTAFQQIEQAEVTDLLEYMTERNFVENLKLELIVGYEGEKLTSSRDFFSMFTSPEFFKVVHACQPVGEIPFTPAVKIDANILLAARMWKIIDTDLKAKKIHVVPAHDGKKPVFTGEVGDVHPRIREKMLEVLYSDILPAQADESVSDALHELRTLFSHVAIRKWMYDRPYFEKEKDLEVYTFTGSKINRTISFMLQCAGIQHDLNDQQSCLTVTGVTDTAQIIDTLQNRFSGFALDVAEAMIKTPGVFKLSKWGYFLPFELKQKYIIENYFDCPNTFHFLEHINLIRG